MCQQTQGGCAGLEALFSVLRVGPWLASEGWVKEQPFIAGVAAAFTLSGLALLYSVVSGEYAAVWFIWMPIVLLAALAPGCGGL